MILNDLEGLGSEKLRGQNANRGVHSQQFGVKLGDIRKLAKPLGTNHALALDLWQTEVFEARLLAILIIDPKALAADEVTALVCANSEMQVADWLSAYVIKKHPNKETLRADWMQAPHPMAARAGWSLTAERIEKTPDGLDLPALLDRIEAEMPAAPPEVQWTMNMALANIGIHHAALRPRALDIGERLGIFRDYPTPKGCTSPFAPLWIGEMVRRQAVATA
ncbi:DNA alkylation repair protein [Abyssibius alkaniclasticus]|uniref:DNA alkylation repair protein n=1 Tax=Abyssibius alkaniclasticus TaxID=2881234 RepID=UPI004057F5E5